MRQWRVGSLSMALVLIVLGVVLVTAQFLKIPAVELLVNWWPAVLVLLGLEILLAGYFAKSDAPRFKYDFFAVVMVTLVGIISMGIYGLNSTGLVEAANRAFSSSFYTVELPENHMTLPKEIKKIVLEKIDANIIIFSAENSKEIVSFGQTGISAASREEADAAAQEVKVKKKIIGDTLYLSLEGIIKPQGLEVQGIHDVSLSLLLPDDLNLGVLKTNNYHSVDLMLDTLHGNWFVQSNGPITVKTGQEADLTIQVGAASQLGGDVDWIKNEAAGEKAINGFEQENYRGEYLVGEGGGFLQLSSRGAIDAFSGQNSKSN